MVNGEVLAWVLFEEINNYVIRVAIANEWYSITLRSFIQDLLSTVSVSLFHHILISCLSVSVTKYHMSGMRWLTRGLLRVVCRGDSFILWIVFCYCFYPILAWSWNRCQRGRFLSTFRLFTVFRLEISQNVWKPAKCLNCSSCYSSYAAAIVQTLEKAAPTMQLSAWTFLPANNRQSAWNPSIRVYAIVSQSL